jgi:type 1 glutamine amidotransferase
MLAKAPEPADVQDLRPIHLVLLADVKDHGPGAHDYPCWQDRWALLLGGEQAAKASVNQVNMYGPPVDAPRAAIAAGLPKVEVSTAWKWPSEEQFQRADLIAMFCYRSGGARRTWNDRQVDRLRRFIEQGGGFVAIHPAAYTLRDLSTPAGQKIAQLTGMAFDGTIKVRHGAMHLMLDTKHPICLGLPPTVDLVDEPYWPPVGDRNDVSVVATSEEAVGETGGNKAPQPMFWTSRLGDGRVFCCVPGHFNWTFDDPLFRVLLLRGMAWAAGESPYRFDPLVTRGIPLGE